MRYRLAAIPFLILVSAALASSQPLGTYSKAVPPNKAVLDRLNLRTEWTQFIPVEGSRDALTQIQTIGDQVFVQTRAGLFGAIDVRTGRIQWAVRLGNGTNANSYPCAANSKFVFVAHVTKLYAFYRYTGQVEFVTDTGTPATVGLAADETGVYCVLGMRPGSAGAHRIAVYNLPRPVVVSEPVKTGAESLTRAGRGAATSPVDEILKRYAAGAMPIEAEDVSPPLYRPNILSAPIAGVTGSKTPSLGPLPSVVPPYNLDNRSPSPSLNPLPSVHRPYHLRQPSGRYIQATPSLGVIPPSLAASMMLSDLRPKGISPPLRWEYGMTARVLYPLILTPVRAWAVLEGNAVVALNKNSEAGHVVSEVRDRLPSPIAAAPKGSGTNFYVPMGNGALLALDAPKSSLDGGVTVKWRADVGGINNHSPYITKKYVYASSDNGGVTCVERATGKLVWRSASSADRVIGANEEFLYVRDHRGRLLVYDAKRPSDPARRIAAPLGSVNLPEFNVNIINTANDRIYLAANNGLIVCLRDASPKYTKPVVIWPPMEVNPNKRVGVELQPKKDQKSPEPKKE